MDAIVLKEISLWDGKNAIPDLTILKLNLGIISETSVIRNYTIKPDAANIPEHGQISKHKINRIVSKNKEFKEENDKLRRLLRQERKELP